MTKLFGYGKPGRGHVLACTAIVVVAAVAGAVAAVIAFNTDLDVSVSARRPVLDDQTFPKFALCKTETMKIVELTCSGPTAPEAKCCAVDLAGSKRLFGSIDVARYPAGAERSTCAAGERVSMAGPTWARRLPKTVNDATGRAHALHAPVHGVRSLLNARGLPRSLNPWKKSRRTATASAAPAAAGDAAGGYLIANRDFRRRRGVVLRRLVRAARAALPRSRRLAALRRVPGGWASGVAAASGVR